MTILVTGGSGFIGSAFIRRLAGAGVGVENLDAGTYAADERRLDGCEVSTHRADIRDGSIAEKIASSGPRTVVHFAAETHVTRSESDEELFFAVNVDGTANLLDAAAGAGVETFVHVSTDEIYGPATGTPFIETDKEPGEGLATSAYARSKAVADDLVRAYEGPMKVVIARPTNCFGPWQHPEKAVARWTCRALSGRRLPVWGDGQQVRDWMYVDDCCAAIELLIEKGEPSVVYNIGPGNEAVSNLEIATSIASAAGVDPSVVYLTEYDRPQHDRRYSVDASAMRSLGWRPAVGVAEGITRTVEWYSKNRPWWEELVSDAESLYRDDAERAS